jgi:glycosyltransferase involved in cell wall biosynthesis
VAMELTRRLNSTIIYDCHDLIEGFEDISPEVVRSECTAMQMADSVLFSAEWLMMEHNARCPGLATKSVVVRNAVNPADFPLAEQKESSGTPIIGYVGSLNSWFDIQMLEFAASARPDWQFVLVGPSSPGFPRDAVSRLKNVRFTGEVPYSTLPDWLHTFDVALIPFHVRPLTLATNPVKLYEYFAHGMPVVSTRLPEVERYADLVYLASSPEEFVTRIECAIGERDPSLRTRRRQVADRETWDERSRAVLDAAKSVPLQT